MSLGVIRNLGEVKGGLTRRIDRYTLDRSDREGEKERKKRGKRGKRAERLRANRRRPGSLPLERVELAARTRISRVLLGLRRRVDVVLALKKQQGRSGLI